MKKVFKVSATTTQTVAHGEKAIKPSSPTKPGYEFIGWSTNKDTFKEFDFNTKITEDVNLYAFWNEDDSLIKVGIINLLPQESAVREANIRDLADTFTLANGYKAYNYHSNNFAEQFTAFNQFIEDGVDYILLAAASVSKWDEAIKNAKKANIPVILFDRLIDCPNFTAAVVSDKAAEGETAVNWLIRQDFSEYKVLHLQGILRSTAQIGRTASLNKIASLNAVNLSIVKQQTGNWCAEEAKKIVQEAIKEEVSFNVIYAENDDMAKGAIQALDDAGIPHGVGGGVIIISFDCNKWALEELLKGKWNFNVQSSPFQGAYLHKTIQDLENGIIPTQKIIFTEERSFDARTITQTDIEKYGV